VRTNCCPILVPLAIVILPALASEAAGANAQNATPTKQPGVYFVMPVLKEVTGVHVIPLAAGSKDEKRVLERKDCKYDPKTGKIDVKVPVDDKTEMICVFGDPVVPWAWHLPDDIVVGSVRVLLRDQEAKLHQDFEIDTAKQQIRFLKPADCEPGTKYLIVYDLVSDPKRPTEHRAGSFGNHDDKALIDRFLKRDKNTKAGR
jgi:hypothetical protein